MLHEQFKLELLAAPNSASGGEMYRSLLAFLQEQVSKAVLGRSDAADATSGKLGNAQDSMQVRQDILESDAAELAATLNAQLFQPFIDLNFGPQAAYPVFAFHFPEVEDKTLLLQLLRDQVPLGLKVEQSIIRDKFNLPDPPDGAELLGANTPSTPVDRTSPAANRALNRAAGSAHVEKAIAEGTTIQTFRKDFERIVAERGWTGWTGEDTKAGRAWRTRVIYDTNLFTSYSAGRFRQIKEVADLHHYWRYRHSPASVEPRPEHVAWDGIILRHDDPWWTTHYPPGGFGCKCYVETLAERDLKKQGLAVTDKEQILFNGKDPKTGLPLGIDKGWDYQPGASVEKDLAIFSKKMALQDRQVAVAAVAELVSSPVFNRWLENPQGLFPLAIISDGDAAAIGAKTTLAHLSKETVVKQKAHHPELTPGEYTHAQQCVDRGERIQDGPLNLIYLLEEAGYVTVVKATKTGESLFVSSFRRLSNDAAKRDSEIRRLRRKGT